MKKVLSYFITINLIINIYLVNINAFAYSLVKSENEYAVDSIKNDIYDLKKEYNRMFNDFSNAPLTPSYNNKFWWPVGSATTTVVNGVTFASDNPQSVMISSPYGPRGGGFHRGVDITASAPYGQVNIIAAKSGTVIYPSDGSPLNCPSGSHIGDTCGGGYGNYVIIEHSDGNYTVYAHLYEGSITVRAGQTVSQGQVIGKMGSSGNSSGIHLHFEIRIGQNNYSAAVNPLEYISANDPRPHDVSGNSFSLTQTSLSKAEFKAKLLDYYNRGGVSQNFETTFIANSDSIYEIATSKGVNPEIVIVTALGESGFKYHSDNNYWGIGASNGSGSERSYSSFSAGVSAYCDLIYSYVHGANQNAINQRAAQRQAAGCNPLAYGTPDTLSGTQSIYSFLGNYRWNPGCSSDGGCYYLNIMYGSDYCSKVKTCSSACGSNSCPADSATTIQEQCDYTVWQVQKKVEYRRTIFGI